MGRIIRTIEERNDKRTREDMLRIVQRDWSDYIYGTASQCKDPEILAVAIDSQPKDAYVNSFNRDKQFTLSQAAFGIDKDQGEYVYSPLRWADKSLQKDKNLVLSAVDKNWRAIQYASKDLQNDYDVVMTAIASQKQNSALFIEDQKQTFSVVYEEGPFGKEESYVHNGVYIQSPLAYASKFKNNKEVVLAAVKKNGLALGYASADLKNDLQVVLEAVKGDEMALGCASMNLRNNSQVVLEAVKKHGSAFQFASKELRGDRKIAFEALKTYGDVAKFASPELKNDRTFIGLNDLLSSAVRLPFDNNNFNSIIRNLDFEDELVYETAKALVVNPRKRYLEREMERKEVDSIDELPRETVESINNLVNNNLNAIEEQRQMKSEHKAENFVK